MPSAIFPTDKMDWSFTHKSECQAAFTALVFRIMLDDFAVCQSGFQFSYHQTICQTFIISMERDM
jgi:hypothetical protein